MTASKFRKLSVGDTVTLSAPLRAYNDGPIIPAGSVGTVGAVRVPSVRAIRGTFFACVDFPAIPQPFRHDLTYQPRVAAFPADLA